MADGRDDGPATGGRKGYLTTEIFRCFPVALDPRKLLVAAAGILVMSLGWYALSAMFYYDKPLPDAREYTDAAALKADFPAAADADLAKEGKKKYDRDLARWQVLDELAGPGGKIRTMPWYEYRGPNPYLFATNLLSSPSASWWDAIKGYFLEQIPVLAEPLFKLLLPVVKVADPNASTATRFYLLLVTLWGVATWAFFGGVITRIAVVQLSGKDRITLPQAVKFVASRYWSYLFSPLVPLALVGVVVLGLVVFGLFALIPIVGDVIFYGLLFPVIILGGVAMAILLVGLVGYPMMYTTLSTEGSDTFDAMGRCYSYVFQAPWQYLWYSLVAVFYGAAITFFVVFVGSLMVYLGKWAVMQTPLTETTNQKQDYLFTYAPESFGWKELLLKGSPIEVAYRPELRDGGRVAITYPEKDPAAAKAYRDTYTWWNKVGAGMVTFWLVFVLLLMIGFAYSYFWTVMTMIYLLMRKKIDDIDLDEVYLEDDAPETPYAPPPPPPVTPAADGRASLPMVPPPPAVPPVPPPPAKVEYTGPVAATVPPPATLPPVPPAPVTLPPTPAPPPAAADVPPPPTPPAGE